MFNFRIFVQVRNCRLVNLLDLALEKNYVRSKIAEYMNYLIDIGVAGFRIDAAKHMWPGDVKAILDELKDLNTKWFSAGAKPFTYREVIFISLSLLCVHIFMGTVYTSYSDLKRHFASDSSEHPAASTGDDVEIQ